jgi:putative intracellular protease/amidase
MRDVEYSELFSQKVQSTSDVARVCTGIDGLAATGLLDGGRVTRTLAFRARCREAVFENEDGAERIICERACDLRSKSRSIWARARSINAGSGSDPGTRLTSTSL